MAPLELSHNSFLIRKVLIERRNVDAGAFGHAVRREPFPAIPDENVSTGFQDRFDGRPGAFLRRGFTGFKAPLA